MGRRVVEAGRVAVGVLVVVVLAPGVALAESPPDAGWAFSPAPASQPIYVTHAPHEDPERQRHVVEGSDGAGLYVETWLPAPGDGGAPPARIPTILIATPYVAQGREAYLQWGDSPAFIPYMTQRGYAVAQHHIRGTGESGGCLGQTDPQQIDDVARVIEYLGRDAPWSDGSGDGNCGHIWP